ncbi:hypothetical protein ElyMa_004188800 [Elysia marginata]|uniref:Uncharacterized protein n=1 Tax=Elysia marginata TaxID=1093978 RepID=A0AAV4GKK7_9GAST|nr:hypothetical protein ElyMa_004188800 [Elysia marginata]
MYYGYLTCRKYCIAQFLYMCAPEKTMETKSESFDNAFTSLPKITESLKGSSSCDNRIYLAHRPKRRTVSMVQYSCIPQGAQLELPRVGESPIWEFMPGGGKPIVSN